MARLFIEKENRTLTDVAEIRAYLQPHGIWYERWETTGRLSDTPTDAEILAEFAPEVEKLKQQGAFVTADVINVKPDTPNLDAMLNKFNKEHTHSEDEVRFTVSGRGVFHIHPEQGPVFAVEVESGDLINVPRGSDPVPLWSCKTTILSPIHLKAKGRRQFCTGKWGWSW